MSCILLFYLVVHASLAAPQPPAIDPDTLYAGRAELPSARAAVQVWETRLRRNSNDFESAWKLARARYWLGGHAPAHERRTFLDQGIAAARAAIAIDPKMPEGHFWLAANMGALAESFGLRQGLKYRGDIKSELLTVLRLDPAFQQGSAERALGRWYFKVPGLFGGSNKTSEEYLRRSLRYNPSSSASLYFLAETLIALKRQGEARGVLERLLAGPLDPEWAPEDREFKQKGSVLVKTLS